MFLHPVPNGAQGERSSNRRRISRQLPKRECKWSTKFLETNNASIEARENLQRLKEHERRLYRPRLVDSSALTCFLDYEVKVVPILHKNSSSAYQNHDCTYCSKSTENENILKCLLCPAVSHPQCSVQNDSTRSKSTGNNSSGWWCSDCRAEVQSSVDQERTRLNRDRQRKLEFFSALNLQSTLMQHKARICYTKLRQGMLRLQAQARGVAKRVRFMTELATNARAWRLKIGEYALTNVSLEITSNMACVICIINNESEELEEQMYRFDTQGTSQHNISGKWNESFFVFSCNSLAKLCFTVHDRDDLTRSNFVGQYVVDARKLLQRAFFTGKTIQCKGLLGPLELEPREQGNKAGFRLDQTAIESISGKITFEINPVSNVESKCGYLEQIISPLLKGARKKWYAVLENKQLFLFSQYGDTRPKASLLVGPGTSVEWNDEERKTIRVETLNQTWLLTSPNVVHRLCWYSKVRHSPLKNELGLLLQLS